MSEISIEIGENKKASLCHCCGQAGCSGHGFIYKDASAYGVYYAAWAPQHLDRGVTLAICVGDWDDDAPADARTCAGLEAYEGEGEVLFRSIGPEASPWPSSELLGPMLSRSAALAHPLKSEFLVLAEEVVRAHVAVAEFLHVR
jgi:hypothetical protein